MKTTYIAFLRAVNVGGRTVKMERLREIFGELGFDNVRTYIQSGNVFFDAAKADQAALEAKIEKHLAKALGYDVPTFVRTIAEVEKVMQLDPFRNIKVTPEVRLFVIFISKPLPSDTKLPLSSPKGDFEVIQTTPGEAFVVLRRTSRTAVSPAAFLEKKFGLKATSRFYGTTGKILQAAKS